MESLLNADLEVFKFINDLDPGFLEIILIGIRNRATWIPLYLILVIYIIVQWKRKSWLPILFTVLTVASADYLSSEVVKKTVQRPRPCHTLEQIDVRVHCGTGYSFTSSHATTHMSIAVFWIQLFVLWGRHRWWFLPWALLIGFAQIFVGVHYPLDVLSGYILGGSIGVLFYFLYGKTYQKIYPSESV